MKDWQKSYLVSKGIYITDYKENEKITKVVTQLRSQRPFVGLVTPHSINVNAFFQCVAYKWFMDTGLGFKYVTLPSLIAFDEDEIYECEKATLLLMRADSAVTNNKAKKPIINNLLLYRLTNQKPTLYEVPESEEKENFILKHIKLTGLGKIFKFNSKTLKRSAYV